MLIDDILKHWDTDCGIDEDDIGGSALKTPNLHAKYLRILIDYKLKKSKASADLAEKRVVKSKYFRNMLTTDELKQLGWEPYQYRVLKGEVEELVDSDKDIMKIQSRIEYYTAAIQTLESIMNEIKNRSFHTRISMDWIKFRAGG